MAFFTKQSIFGLDVSDYSIECLLLTKKMGKFGIKSYSRLKLAPGIVENGIILKKEKLAQNLIEALAKAKPKKITSKKVILSLPESRTFIHIFKSAEIPKGAEIKEGIIFEASKIIPLNFSEIYADFFIYKNEDVLFAAAPKKVVDDYVEVIKMAKLELAAVDLESLSIGRALSKAGNFPPEADQPRAEKDNFLVADIGARYTNLSIFNNIGELRASAIINIAGNRFTQAIAEETEVDFEKAEKLKQTYGLTSGDGDKRIRTTLEREILPIIEKIKELLKYCEVKAKKILLVGGSAQMPEIASYFSKNLNIETELGKSKIADEFKEESVLYENVVGLALRGLILKPAETGINLLPPLLKKKFFLQLFLERKIKLWVALIFLIAEALLFLIGFKTLFNELDKVLKDVKISIEQTNIIEQNLYDMKGR